MKGIRFICIRSFNCPVILIVLFVLMVWGYSCSKQPSKPKDIKRTSIDYFGPNGSTSMKIHSAEYTLINDYVKWVHVLYQEKDFNAIEKHISDLLKSKDEAKSYELHILYHALGEITNDKHIDYMRSVLDEWCNKHAKSYIPWLIRGIFYTKYAWTFRGGGPAITVPKDAWPKFHANFELAQKDLEKSWEINPNDPNSSSHLIGVAVAQNYPREKMEQYYENGTKVLPWHYGVRMAKLRYLKPKWHGSYEEMFEFANQCLRSSEEHPFHGFVWIDAVLEKHRFINPKRENILGSDEYWPTVQNIYTTFFTQYPDDIRRRFFYAYHAFEARKYELASRQFEIIGDRWMEDNCWRDLEAYNLGRGYTYYKVGANLLWFKKKHEDSIEYFRLSAKYNPTPHAFYGTGLALMYVGRSKRDVVLLREAEQMLKKAVEFKADYTSKPEYYVDKLAEFQLENVRKYLKEIEGKGPS